MSLKVDEQGNYIRVGEVHVLQAPNEDVDAVRLLELKQTEQRLNDKINALKQQEDAIKKYLQILASTYRIEDSSGNIILPPQ